MQGAREFDLPGRKLRVVLSPVLGFPLQNGSFPADALTSRWLLLVPEFGVNRGPGPHFYICISFHQSPGEQAWGTAAPHLSLGVFSV